MSTRRSRIPSRIPSWALPAVPSNLKYDEQTGQVYAEFSVRVKSMISPWLKKSTGTKEDPSKYRNKGLGASSLYDAAMRSCAWHIDLFEPDVLVCAEWAYAECIYKRLVDRDALSLKTWTLFHKAFPDTKELERSFTLQIPAKTESYPQELELIGRQLNSLPPSTLICLNLRGLSLESTHLMDLLKMPNLAVLVLEQSPSLCRSKEDGGINDRFMHNWGRAVYDVKAFTKLKAMVFRNFPTSLQDTFQCFTIFPRLVLCNLDSWLAAYDMKEMKNGAGVPPKGRWKHLPTEGSEAQGRGKNPENTWKRSDKTIHEKMELLHDLAGTLVPRSDSEKSENNPVVSIHYGDATHYCDRRSYSAWFVRVPPSRDELAILPAKRPRDEGGAAMAMKYEPKKKNIKSGKKQDIGALLGAFA